MTVVSSPVASNFVCSRVVIVDAVVRAVVLRLMEDLTDVSMILLDVAKGQRTGKVNWRYDLHGGGSGDE